MENQKITLEDIAFHIKRLTEALETFSLQVKEDKVVYSHYEPKKVKQQNSKIDEEVREGLRMRANILRKSAPLDYINKLLNPTPSEFVAYKAKHIEFDKDLKRRELKQRQSERQQLQAIGNNQALDFDILKAEDIKSNYIIISAYSEYSGPLCGRIGELSASVQFPISLHKIKKDLTMGILPMQVDSLDNIRALIDPSQVNKKLNKHLIELAMKHQVSFDGLKYFRK